MKKVLMFWALAIGGIAWMGCGLTEPENVSIVESKEQEILEPVPGIPIFDACYNLSKHKVDFSDIEENREIEFEFDLSRIETGAAKQLIVDLYNTYEYSEYCLVDLCYDNMDGVDVTEYVVGLDDDFWLIVCDSCRAYAIKDEWGIYSGEFDYLIEDTELYR